MTTEFDVTNFDALRISLANAEDVRGWSRGEVKKPETINYRHAQAREGRPVLRKNLRPDEGLGGAPAASTSACASRASCASAAAWRSRAARCAASAWATSNWPRRSATSGTSRARPRAWATCWTSRRRSWRKSCTSRVRSSRRWTRRPARRMPMSCATSWPPTLRELDAEA